ncbi:hypothetical protein GCK32_014056 [Trichostrongylus colubriformis]|uniref:Uncharacterized protein n=1 Tax=Trichostrongylus colubriformis TaxID=6319 RepID=A0AAN8IJY5_TRICO
MRRMHDKAGIVEQRDDSMLEEGIENICNMSIAMTRDILRGQYNEEMYKNYQNIHTLRSQIPNKERRSRTKVLTAVTDSTNKQLLS